jgi:hypothetical protein
MTNHQPARRCPVAAVRQAARVKGAECHERYRPQRVVCYGPVSILLSMENVHQTPARPPEADERRWVVVQGFDGRCYVIGNCHTFRGRMACWSESTGQTFAFSQSEVLDASDMSRAWIDGFLAGNEPQPEEMFGIGIYDADDSDPRWSRWRDAVRQFRATGHWPHGPWHDVMPFPPSTRLSAFVWTLRGDEVWTWDGASWIRAEPPPERHFRSLRGTVCDQRGHHDLTAVTSVHSVCDDCGYTVETVPADISSEEWERVRRTYRPRAV